MDNLCYDILFHICEYVDLNDVINIKLISKQFDEILNDDFLWKTYYVREYNIKHMELNKMKNKDAYKKCHDINVLKCKLNINKSIIDMMNLQEIQLIYKQIKEIPHEIGLLINLQKLYLFENQIKEIPHEIGSLS